MVWKNLWYKIWNFLRTRLLKNYQKVFNRVYLNLKIFLARWILMSKLINSKFIYEFEHFLIFNIHYIYKVIIIPRFFKFINFGIIFVFSILKNSLNKHNRKIFVEIQSNSQTFYNKSFFNYKYFVNYHWHTTQIFFKNWKS